MMEFTEHGIIKLLTLYLEKRDGLTEHERAMVVDAVTLLSRPVFIGSVSPNP